MNQPRLSSGTAPWLLFLLKVLGVAIPLGVCLGIVNWMALNFVIYHKVMTDGRDPGGFQSVLLIVCQLIAAPIAALQSALPFRYDNEFALIAVTVFEAGAISVLFLQLIRARSDASRVG